MKLQFLSLILPTLFITSLTTTASAIELKKPPVVICMPIQNRSEVVKDQLVQLEIIIYNWKTTHSDILSTLIDNIKDGRGITPEFDRKMKAKITRLNELTLSLDEETSKLETLAKNENNLVVKLSDKILAHKSSSISFLKVILGSSEATLKDAKLAYDDTWADFGQTWNMVYGMYGCSSTNPWVTF